MYEDYVLPGIIKEEQQTATIPVDIADVRKDFYFKQLPKKDELTIIFEVMLIIVMWVILLIIALLIIYHIIYLIYFISFIYVYYSKSN